MDAAPPEVRRASVELELSALADLGLGAAELDLRGYFGHQQRLRRDLAGVCMAWLRGGNTFMLRYALARSGADTVFRELLAANALVYAGYSAGACVLSPSLRGLELVDDADAVTRTYGSPPMWDGLAVLGEAFIPALPVTGASRDGCHRAGRDPVSRRRDRSPHSARRAGPARQRPRTPRSYSRTDPASRFAVMARMPPSRYYLRQVRSFHVHGGRAYS